MIRVTFLGTAASRPTVGRNVSAVSLQREGKFYLFDCGEGTQRQMMRFGTGFSLDAVFITHLHADHFLGLIGLTRTLSLQGRTEPLPVYGPPRSEPILSQAIHLGLDRLAFPVKIHELRPGEGVRGDGYGVQAYENRHGTSSVGYVLREGPRPGRFDVERARTLGVPEGPLFGRLHRGEVVEVEGRTIAPEEVVGPPRSGRSVVYTGDTRPCRGTKEVAADADLLIHDATFGDDERDRAAETYHTTARQAGELARTVGARRLVLTHLSARYAQNASPLERQARAAFPGARVAYDGLSVEIPFRGDEPERSENPESRKKEGRA